MPGSQLGAGERQLDERERVARGLGQQAGADVGRERLARPSPAARRRRRGVEPLDPQLREAARRRSRRGPRRAAGSARTPARRATNASTSIVERSSQCASSTTITTGAAVATSLSTLSVARAIRKRSGRVAVGHPEGGEHRVALRRGERVEVVEHGPQQLVQAGEREPGLGLHAGRAQDPHPALGGERRPPPAARTCRSRARRAAADRRRAREHGEQVMQAPQLRHVRPASSRDMMADRGAGANLSGAPSTSRAGAKWALRSGTWTGRSRSWRRPRARTSAPGWGPDA